MRSEQGVAAPYLLGSSLLVLLLTLGLGLADSVRATAYKTLLIRSTIMATQGAARTLEQGEAEARQTFARLMDENMDLPYTVNLRLYPDGGTDPITGRRFKGPAAAAEVRVELRLAYLGHFLPAVTIRAIHGESAPPQR